VDTREGTVDEYWAEIYDQIETQAALACPSHDGDSHARRQDNEEGMGPTEAPSQHRGDAYVAGEVRFQGPGDVGEPQEGPLYRPVWPGDLLGTNEELRIT
jgi:hypothetical protein